jgi:2-oxoglutarate ferredoxin oxidoreductase subunit gamma
MLHEIIFSGFGGQGVIVAGRLLCIAAMNEGRFVSHIPSYGAEMRGGTANCSVVVSDEEIASPVVYQPSVLIALNAPSFKKFVPGLRRAGSSFTNTSLIAEGPGRADITGFGIPANDISEAEGSSRGANMAALGSLLRLVPGLCSLESLITALDEGLSSRNAKYNEINIKILKAGYTYGSK